MAIPVSHQMLIDELRSRLRSSGVLEGKYDTDFNLLRWLQGFDFDVEKVVPKLRYHLRFRKAWNLDDIMESEERDSMVMALWSGYHGGPTKKENNFIVFADYLGLPDFPGIMSSFSPSEVIHTRSFVYESMLDAVMKQEEVTGRQSGVAYIIDLQGLKFDAETIKLVTGPFKSLCSFLTDHYVELFGQIYLVNVPSFMYYLWKILQPVIADKTAKKIVIMGSDWRDQLLNYIDADALPRQWGGELQAPPNFHPPQPVPLELYWTETDRQEHLFKSNQLKVLLIPAGKSDFLNIGVDTEGQILSWKYLLSAESECGVFFSESESEGDVEKMEMVHPHFLLMTGPHQVPNRAEIVCQKLGFYKFWFRNPAWFFTLKVWNVIKNIGYRP